mmetsp:Transcript_24945/g.36882  ORF Transcript_24945/g.36882 Transcript_24945/m.36882 type:complete len:81 (+) Transcript_24945:178-420(+)
MHYEIKFLNLSSFIFEITTLYAILHRIIIPFTLDLPQDYYGNIHCIHGMHGFPSFDALIIHTDNNPFKETNTGIAVDPMT